MKWKVSSTDSASQDVNPRSKKKSPPQQWQPAPLQNLPCAVIPKSRGNLNPFAIPEIPISFMMGAPALPEIGHHRIIELLGLAGLDHPVPTPAVGWLPPTRSGCQGLSDGASTASIVHHNINSKDIFATGSPETQLGGEAD